MSRCVLATLAMIFLASAAAAQAVDPKVAAKLQELGRASAAVRTLRAHFVQEKHLAIVRDVLRSSGTFLLDKQGRIAWDVTEPERVRVVITKEGLFVGGRRVGAEAGGDASAKLSPLPMLEGLHGVFGGVSEEITRDFEVKVAGENRLRLVPRSRAVAGWLSAIDVTLGGQTKTPEHVRLEEPGGDVTEVTFTDVILNPKLDDEAFAP